MRDKIIQIENLYLPDHHRVTASGLESTPVPYQFGSITYRGDDTWFFNDHRNSIVQIIDQEVGRNA